MDQKELIHRIVHADDEKAFRFFFDRYYPKLIDFALNYVKSKAIAQDIVSDLLLNLLTHKNLTANIKNLDFYLFSSVKNRSISYLRRQKHREISDPDQEQKVIMQLVSNSEPEQEYLNQELDLHLQKALETLPPRRRLIFNMVKNQGLRHKEVAKLLEISPRTVENHLDLAIKDLRNHLESYFSDKRPADLLLKIAKSLLPLSFFWINALFF